MAKDKKHTTLAYPDRENGKPKVLLLVQNAQDREVFRELMPDNLDIECCENGLEDRDFELCILDEQAYQMHKDVLVALKERSAPVFAPVMLLSDNQDRIRKRPELTEFADDVVYIPASKKLMQSRISLLLQQREYSMKLQEKNRQLEKANRQLKDEKEKFQFLARNSTDMISRHKPDGTYLYASEACKELVGYTPEELVGQNAYDNMHPEDRQEILKEHTPFPDKDIVRWAFRKQTKSGDYKWVEANMRPIKDDSGEIVEIQASTRDISARKEYEQKLKDEKEFIDKSIESLPELFYMIDEDQNFVKWTNVERELGYTDEEVREMHPLDFYRQEDHAEIITKISQAFKTGSAEAELEMRAKNGDIIPYYITAKRFSRGDDLFLVGTCVNLSEIKETEFQLKQHQQLLDAIINQTESVIYVKDENRKYRLVNDSYLEVFGLEREEVIGETDQEIHGTDIDQEVLDNDRAVIENGQTIEIEERIPVGGEDRLYHTIKYPLKGVPGFEKCVCGISTDITDLKKATSKLEERVKEQRCLYNISSLPDKVSSIDELLQEAVDELPDGWQYPDITEAQIKFDDKKYQTKGFSETNWMLEAENNRIQNKPLQVRIAYTEKREIGDEGPFLSEERQLIDSLTDSIASHLNRILAQQKLKESEQRWESLVKNDPDLIQILDEDGNIQFVNDAGARILGFNSPDEIIGKNYFDLVELEHEESELTKQRVKQVLEGNEINPHIFKIRDSNNEMLYLESKAVPITLDDGRPGLQQVAQDVTDRIEYQRKLKQSLNEKETLLQEIHHRVKNNLAVVSGMMELQTFSTKNEEVKKQLNDSKNRIKTMALIHEKLYQSESLSRIDFGSYVEDLLSNIKELSSVSDKIEVDLQYDSFNLNVNQAVPTALIINEVVSNSFEHAFTDRDEGRVEVRLHKEGRTVNVSIRDNGCGLKEEFHEKKKESMGFTIIETLIRQLEAEEKVDNEDGFGFAFSFKKQEIKGSSSSLV